MVHLALDASSKCIADPIALACHGDLDRDLTKEAECHARLVGHIREAWAALLDPIEHPARSIPVRVVSRIQRAGAQMTLTGTPAAPTCLLDVGAWFDSWGATTRSLIWHELYHLRDRLRASFELDVEFDAALRDPRRRTLGALWDVTIEARKYLTHRVEPWQHLAPLERWGWPPPGSSPRESVANWLGRIFGSDREWVSHLMRRYWSAEPPTYPSLVDGLGEAEQEGLLITAD